MCTSKNSISFNEMCHWFIEKEISCFFFCIPSNGVYLWKWNSTDSEKSEFSRSNYTDHNEIIKNKLKTSKLVILVFLIKNLFKVMCFERVPSISCEIHHNTGFDICSGHSSGAFHVMKH